MILPLVDWCLLAVRDSIVYGLIKDISQLDPKLRHRVLDMILIQGSIIRKYCLSTLSSPEFLNGLTSLNLQYGTVDDHKYLERVTNSLDTMLDTDDTIGECMEELRLNLYGYESDTFWTFTNLKAMAVLMSKCPNLRLLNIHYWDVDRPSMDEPDQKKNGNILLRLRQKFIEKHPPNVRQSDTILKKDSAIINRSLFDPCWQLFNNLRELSLKGKRGTVVFFDVNSPMEEFRHLQNLSLKHCMISSKAFTKLEKSIRKSLMYLDIDYIRSESDKSYLFVIQVPYPRLRRLCCRSCISVVSRNLKACPKLEHLHVSITSEDTASDLAALNEIKAKVTMDLFICHKGEDDDFSSTLQVINVLGEKLIGITSWWFAWNDQFAMALEHAMHVCQNLEKLELIPCFDENQDKHKLQNGWKRGMFALLHLFSNQERALQLRNLQMRGDIDPVVLNALFDNCINLDSFSMDDCPQLMDMHLMHWAERGARPTDLTIRRCTNVTEHGLVAVLENTGENLQRFWFKQCQDQKSLEPWNHLWPALATYCRYIRMIYCDEDCDCDENIRSQFFNVFIGPC